MIVPHQTKSIRPAKRKNSNRLVRAVIKVRLWGSIWFPIVFITISKNRTSKIYRPRTPTCSTQPATWKSPRMRVRMIMCRTRSHMTIIVNLSAQECFSKSFNSVVTMRVEGTVSTKVISETLSTSMSIDTRKRILHSMEIWASQIAVLLTIWLPKLFRCLRPNKNSMPWSSRNSTSPYSEPKTMRPRHRWRKLVERSNMSEENPLRQIC